MGLLFKLMRKLNVLMQLHYKWLAFLALIIVTFVAFLDYEYKRYQRDLIYWCQLLHYYYREMEHLTITFVTLVIFAKVVFVGFLILWKANCSWLDELSHLEVKRRYGDFLLIRLLSDIESVQQKLFSKMDSAAAANADGGGVAAASTLPPPSSILTMDDIIGAHREMHEKVSKFRKDARKYLAPNEIEMSMPIEEVYGILEDEDRALRRSRFYSMNLTASDELIRVMVNPL